jgi:hypothetical protein
MAGNPPKAVDSDGISSSAHTEARTPANLSDDEKHSVGDEKGVTARPKHINRRVSEWEALQIAAAGDMETIDAEVQDLEDEVTARGKSFSDRFQLNFKDPRHYTW